MLSSILSRNTGLHIPKQLGQLKICLTGAWGCVLTDHYFERGQLAASFFFSKSGGDVGKASKFVTTISLQIAMHILPIQRHLRDTATEYNNIASQPLVDQWHQLVVRPLSKLDGSNTYVSYVLVIDALDECEGENDTRIILRLLAEARSRK